jgi:hypothetical protein
VKHDAHGAPCSPELAISTSPDAARRRTSRPSQVTGSALRLPTASACAPCACCRSDSTSCTPGGPDAIVCSSCMYNSGACTRRKRSPQCHARYCSRAMVTLLRKVAALPTLVCLYSMIFVIVPAPTVLPPSRIAKRSPSSIAIGVTSSTESSTLSPGITISVPSGSVAAPVTSVVRK